MSTGIELCMSAEAQLEGDNQGGHTWTRSSCTPALHLASASLRAPAPLESTTCAVHHDHYSSLASRSMRYEIGEQPALHIRHGSAHAPAPPLALLALNASGASAPCHRRRTAPGDRQSSRPTLAKMQRSLCSTDSRQVGARGRRRVKSHLFEVTPMGSAGTWQPLAAGPGQQCAPLQQPPPARRRPARPALRRSALPVRLGVSVLIAGTSGSGSMHQKVQLLRGSGDQCWRPGLGLDPCRSCSLIRGLHPHAGGGCLVGATHAPA